MISLFVTASALAMDAFSVSLASSACMSGIAGCYFLRMVFFFAFFQFAMPILGGFLGASISSAFSRWDHWISFAILLLVGLNMVREAINEDSECSNFDISNIWVVLFLALATSLDAMAVGFSWATLNRPVLSVAISTGFITGGLSLIGVKAGKKLGLIIGQRAQVLGGVLLCFIGINILGSHMGWF